MNILIVDDDNLVCTSLKIILESTGEVTVAGTGHDGTDAVRLYDELLPDILLMDIRMKEMSGLTAAEQIIGRHPDARILLLTTFSDDEYIVKALRFGAKGYLLKQNYDSILPALKAVHSGQSVFGEDIIAKLPSLLGGLPSEASAEADLQKKLTALSLTERDFSVIRLIAEGMSNKEIAEELFLSEGTVRNYLSVILEKLQLRDRTQLAIYYYKHFNS